MAKVFTNSSNCARAAKVALGKDAKRGEQFTIDKVDGGFTWSKIASVEKPKAAKTARADSKRATFITMLKQDGGISLKDACKEFGWQKHTVRGVASTAGATSTKDAERGRVYRIA